MFDLRSNCVLSPPAPLANARIYTQFYKSFHFDTRGHRIGAHTDANSTPSSVSYSQAKFSFHTFLFWGVSASRAWCAQVPAYVLYHSPHSDA